MKGLPPTIEAEVKKAAALAEPIFSANRWTWWYTKGIPPTDEQIAAAIRELVWTVLRGGCYDTARSGRLSVARVGDAEWPSIHIGLDLAEAPLRGGSGR